MAIKTVANKFWTVCVQQGNADLSVKKTAAALSLTMLLLGAGRNLSAFPL